MSRNLLKPFLFLFCLFQEHSEEIAAFFQVNEDKEAAAGDAEVEPAQPVEQVREPAPDQDSIANI